MISRKRMEYLVESGILKQVLNKGNSGYMTPQDIEWIVKTCYQRTRPKRM